jgi:intein-encoded DNA endonuclease-like protein
MNKIKQEEHLNIIEMYNNWIPVKEIAKKYNVSPKPIYKILRDNKIEIRKCTDRQNKTDYITNKKYTFNGDYFEIINSSEKAYWLGFLFADGCVSLRYNNNTGNIKSGVIKIELKREDDYHLRNFVRCLNGDITVKHKTSKCNNKVFETARLDIYSTKMCNDLIKLGCIPNKSLILEPPKNVPEEFYHAFIKGYFDGDGCIGYYPKSKSNKIYLGICGTEKFLIWIMNDLLKYNINSMKISKDKRNNVYTLNIFGRSNMCNFYNYIYNKSSYVLGRKRDLFMKAMIDLNQNANISKIADIADKM